MDISQIIKMARLASYTPLENIITQVIEIGPEGLLEQIIMDNGAYVLKTKTGNFKELAKLAKNIFSIESLLEGLDPQVDPNP